MATFHDSNGTERHISFDAFMLDEIKSRTGIDIADLSAEGLAKLDASDTDVVKVLAVALGLPFKDFAKVLTGDAIESAREAIGVAIANFTPRKRWSVIQSNWETRRTMQEQAATMRMALSVLETMPEGMQQGAMEALMEQMQTAIAAGISAASPESTSVAGPVDTPPPLVIVSPES